MARTLFLGNTQSEITPFHHRYINEFIEQV